MKILWFSLSPCGSLRRNNKIQVVQGWMISLEDELKKNKGMDLAVCYFSDVAESPFVFDGVSYFPLYISGGSNPIQRVLKRKFNYLKRDEYYLKLMLDAVRTFNPDIIHIHGTEERFGLIADFVKDIPIVYSIQGLLAPYKEKYFSGMPYSEVNHYESLYDKVRNVSFKDDYSYFCYRAEREKKILKNAHYILGRTFWDRNITIGLNPKRKYYVVNEILRSPFYNKVWHNHFTKNKMVIVSTISDGIYKGIETVLKTASLLKDYADFSFEWHIAGYDDNSKWLKIAQKITKLDYKKLNIKLHGRIDAEELVNLLLSSDLYCHVSHIENSPNSLCEAMILGLPIIASFTGGCSSILVDGKDGLLVQDGDPYVLEGSIVHAFNHYDELIIMGGNARRRALSRHNPNKVVNELMNSYESILKDFKYEKK